MAVYTALTDKEIWDFLQEYSLPALAVAQGIAAGVENTNYLLKMQNGARYILTLFEKRVAEAELPFFTGLMERLASRYVTPLAIAQPVLLPDVPVISAVLPFKSNIYFPPGSS